MIIIDGEKTDYNVNKDGVISKDGQTIAHAQETTQGYVVTGVDGAKIIIDENGNIKSIDMPTEPTMPEHDELKSVQLGNDGSIYVDGEATSLTAEIHDNSVTYTIRNKDGLVIGEANTIPLKDSDLTVTVVKINDKTIIINEQGHIIPNEALKPALRKLDSNKLQSIDPTKLQKAKSAIQQRLRG
ncbi:hypothetical protein BCT46_00660 [Vibrio sp. 10N.261.46.E8]|nr:hypothetical protein BCT46_00660 [Vibrio sp. 10N.261.46.E8]